MKEMHWSVFYVNFITIEVGYADGARQGWDYDCVQYESLDNVKRNMADDFRTPREDWDYVMLYVLRSGVSYTAELEVNGLTGDEFSAYVFEAIEEMINGN